MSKEYRITKIAQIATDLGDPKLAAQSIAKVINFILRRIEFSKRNQFVTRLKNKIMELDVQSMASKKAPETASIGQSITFIKTILNGRDAVYIQTILYELLKVL